MQKGTICKRKKRKQPQIKKSNERNKNNQSIHRSTPKSIPNQPPTPVTDLCCAAHMASRYAHSGPKKTKRARRSERSARKASRRST